jgi:Flp pilus assembly protein protease CpaA
VKPFFPSPAFAWTFYGVLVALLAMAAVIDLRRVIVPKWLSLTTLGLGVACNVVRGAWMGGADLADWGLAPQWDGAHGAWLGGADGFLFALAGFSAGFGIFFLMWVIGACGGGDVKLFAAVSAWVGPYISLWILALSTVILIMLLVLKLGVLFLVQSPQAPSPPMADKNGKATGPHGSRRARGLTYALPLALATALVLLWFFRVDLKLNQTRARLATGASPKTARGHRLTLPAAPEREPT